MKTLKTIFKSTSFILITVFALTAISCEGDQGEQGPAGMDGNANVMSIKVDDVNISPGNNTISIPELTSDILHNGHIYAYATVNPTNWEPLPIFNSSRNVILDIDQVFEGSIEVTSTFTDSALDFRFILIEGTPSTTTTRLNINFNDYYAVCDYYGLAY